MGPVQQDFEGIASSFQPPTPQEKKPKRKVLAAMQQTAAKWRTWWILGALDGALWAPRTAYRCVEGLGNVMMKPIRWYQQPSENVELRVHTGPQGPVRFTDLGVGTPTTETKVEAPGGEPSGGLEAEMTDKVQQDLLQKTQIAIAKAIDNKTNNKYPTDTKPMHNDCWEGIDTTSMRTLDGPVEHDLDVALMVADPSDAESADGSIGIGPDLPSAAFHDPLLEEDGTVFVGRPTDVYVPAPEELGNSTVFDQLRQVSAEGIDGGTVALDVAAVEEILRKQREAEAQVIELELMMDRMQEAQYDANAGGTGAADVNADNTFGSMGSGHSLAPILEKMTELLAYAQKPKEFSNNKYVITKSLGELKLDMLEDAEHGQIHAWEGWYKTLRLRLKQKASGLVELLDSKLYTKDMEGHSQQLCAALLRQFAEGTRVWDIAQTVIQKHGERADLVVEAIEKEVGRGELFRAFHYTTEFFEDRWMQHDQPWGNGLAVTLSHLNLLKTRLHKENLTVDQLMVLRVAALLPPEFSWLQREIFKSDQMTMDHLQEALKPHVKASVLAVDQAYKQRAVGAASVADKKEAKSLAAITRQNRELTKENALLKQASPEKPTGGKGKGGKGKGVKGGKGKKSTKGKQRYPTICAHPNCKGEHVIRDCPLMAKLPEAEFKKQYKKHLDAFFLSIRSERGSGQAAVELYQPCLTEPSQAKSTEVSEPSGSTEVSVPSDQEVQPDCITTTWSGSVEDLFDQMDLTGAVFNGDTGPEVGLVAGEFGNAAQCFHYATNASRMKAHQQSDTHYKPLGPFQPDITTEDNGDKTNTDVTTVATKYVPTAPRPDGIQKPKAVAKAAAAKPKVIKWRDETKKTSGLFTSHSYPASLMTTGTLLENTLTIRKVLKQKDELKSGEYRMYDKVWAIGQPAEDVNKFCHSMTMWPALVVGKWSSNTLATMEQPSEVEVSYKLIFYSTNTAAYIGPLSMCEWYDGINQKLNKVNDCLVKNAYMMANQHGSESKLLKAWQQKCGDSFTAPLNGSSIGVAHSNGDTYLRAPASPTQSPASETVLNAHAQPFQPIGHVQAEEGELQILYVDCAEQTACGQFVCANVTQTVTEAMGDDDRNENYQMLVDTNKQQLTDEFNFDSILSQPKQYLQPDAYEFDWERILEGNFEVDMEALIEGFEMNVDLDRGMAAAEIPNTSNLSEMGTTNDGVGAPGEEPAQAGEDSQQQSGQGTGSVNIEGHNDDTNDDDEENNHNGEHVFYVPEVAFNCANCGAPCNMVCPFGLCFPCCEMTACGCNEQDTDSDSDSSGDDSDSHYNNSQNEEMFAFSSSADTRSTTFVGTFGATDEVYVGTFADDEPFYETTEGADAEVPEVTDEEFEMWDNLKWANAKWQRVNKEAGTQAVMQAVKQSELMADTGITGIGEDGGTLGACIHCYAYVGEAALCKKGLCGSCCYDTECWNNIGGCNDGEQVVVFNGTNETADTGFELETVAMAAEPEAGAAPEEMQTLVLDQVVWQNSNCPDLDAQEELDLKVAVMNSQSIKCYYCGDNGHTIDECKELVHMPPSIFRYRFIVQLKRLGHSFTLWNDVWERVYDWIVGSEYEWNFGNYNSDKAAAGAGTEEYEQTNSDEEGPQGFTRSEMARRIRTVCIAGIRWEQQQLKFLVFDQSIVQGDAEARRQMMAKTPDDHRPESQIVDAVLGVGDQQEDGTVATVTPVEVEEACTTCLVPEVLTWRDFDSNGVLVERLTPRQCSPCLHIEEAPTAGANGAVSTKRKDTPRPSVGILLGDIEECHLTQPASGLEERPNLNALNMLGDVCMWESAINEESPMEIDSCISSSVLGSGGFSNNLEQEIAAMAGESSTGADSEGLEESYQDLVENWPAPCVRKECPCVSSCNGNSGEWCSRACRGGKPCRENRHKTPYTSGSIQAANTSGLNQGNTTQASPRYVATQRDPEAIAWCVCWLGCTNMLTTQDIEYGNDLCAQCRQRHAAGIMDCCECECHCCTTTAARYQVLAGKTVTATEHQRQHKQGESSTTCSADNNQCWVIDPVTGITDVFEEDYQRSQSTPRKRNRQVNAREAVDAETTAQVDAREAAASRTGNVNVNGRGYVNRTGNVHVNVTVPEVPRQHKQRPVKARRGKASGKGKGVKPASLANAGKGFGQSRGAPTNFQSDPWSNASDPWANTGSSQAHHRSRGMVERVWGSKMLNRVTTSMHHQVNAIYGIAREARDGVMCMHFALYMLVLCMLTVAMNYAYHMSTVMFTSETRARYMLFGLGLMPGLVVHFCPALTRIQGQVQSTWNGLTRKDHYARDGAYEQSGGRQNNRQRGRRNATNFAINRPPVFNKFWILVMIALAWLLAVSDAATVSNAASNNLGYFSTCNELGMQIGANGFGAMGLAGMEYSNASIARTIETLLDSGASRIMLHDKNLFTELRKAQYPLQVQYADGLLHNCWYTGRARLPIRDALTKEIKLLEFDNAWLADKAVFNLVSVHALTKVGYTITFNEQGAVIRGNGVEVNVGSVNRLYILDLDLEHAPNGTACGATDSPVQRPTDELQTLELWHARLSHIGFSQLERLAKMAESPITGMKITNFNKCMCEACIMSKLKDNSHPSKVKHKATAPYEVLWSDLAGPLKIPTRNGEQYVLGIVDEFSRWVWIYLLKTKDEATVKFDEFLTRHSNVKHLIRVVSTDKGGEYQSRFNLMLGRHQIKHWETAANCPAARGSIERVWGTIMPMMACNLRYAGMTHNGLNLWGYALKWAVWCYNRVPHARDSITPFQHLYNQKADVKHARVWGCPCYSHIVVSKQVKTPDKAKALEGIFLGRHEVDGLSSDGDMILTRDGEVISSAVTVFCEDWKLKKSPAAKSVAELNQSQKVPSGKSVILSVFDGISGIIMALKKVGRLDEFDLFVAIEIDGTARMISKAVLANLDVDIEVYREFTDVFELTKENIMAMGNITLFCGGPLCEDFSRKRLLPDFNGVTPIGDPRPGLNGPKGKTFRQTIRLWEMIKELNPDCNYFIENVVFNDMAKDWEEVNNSFGEPTVVDAKDYSYTTRRRAYWTNFTIPMIALQKNPKMNWDECMDPGRTLETKKVYGRQAVPTVCKSWKGDPDNPQERTNYPVRVIDVNNPELMFLRPHEAEKLLGLITGCTAGAGITAISRLKAIGNGWDINVVSMLLGYLPLPDGEQFTDWCIQFKAGDLVRVWSDKETIPAWVNGVVKHMSQPKAEIRVDYPVTAEHPNGAYTIHDLDDGNIQYRDEIDNQDEAVEEESAADKMNDVLIGVSQSKNVMHSTHQVKTRPDRWSGQKGKAVRNSKPYTNYQNIRWIEYHKSNPSKGSTGYHSTRQFAKVIAKEWDALQVKDKQLHELTKKVDADLRSNSTDKCKHCGTEQSNFKNMNSFKSHQSRCSARASINTAALAFETTNASTVETFRVDCEQVGSDWDRCHEGQECMNSTELLNGKLPLPARDTCTAFTLNDGSRQYQVDEQAKDYANQSEWGSVIKRVTTDVESGSIIQDLDLVIAAAASEVVNKHKIRGVDVEVTLLPEQPKIEFANAAVSKKKTVRNENEPQTIREALNGPDAELWKQSIDKEWNALVDQGVFSLVPRSETHGKCVISSKWVFKIKSDNTYKSRCVGRGFQQWNTSIDSAFSPVARLGTVRLMLALATIYGMDLWQQDVVCAFLNAKLGAEDTVFMEVPECYTGQFEGQVLKLNKAIYGLKSSPRLWNKTLDAFFGEMDFKPSAVDPCLYIHHRMIDGVEHTIMILVYVDDLLLISTSVELREEHRKKLKQRFQMSQKVDNKPTELLGMRLKIEDERIEIDQSRYALEVYNSYRDQSITVRSATVPMRDGTKLNKLDADPKYMEGRDYRGLVGSLLYLTMVTRPDICFAVKELSRMLDSPGEEAWKAGQHLLEYVYNTHHYAIRYTKPENAKDILVTGVLKGYSDADWAGQVDDRRSTSGYVFFVAGGPVSWQAKTQKSVALSTAEAEYMALSDASKEAVHLKALLVSIGIEDKTPVVIYEDNQAAQKIAENPVLHDRTKHIDIRYHFVRELVQGLQISVVYIETKQMIADLLTKAVTKVVHEQLVGQLFGWGSA